MKTCDVCGRTDKDISDGCIESLFIGTTIDVARVNAGGIPGARVTNECPVPCELCLDCIERVNRSLACYLFETFGLKIRK